MILHAKKGLAALILIASFGAAWLPSTVFAEGEAVPETPSVVEESQPAAAPESSSATPEAASSESSGSSETTAAEASEPPPAVITTGDAVAETTITNNENLTVIETAPGGITEATSTPPIVEDGTASSTSPTSDGSEATSTPLTLENPEATTTPFTIEGTTENSASTTNESATGASTGDNGASGNGGDASITTGTAAASANVLNVVNTNILNSSGFFFLLNNFWGNLGSLDVRGMSAGDTGDLLSCGTFCNGTSTPLRTTLSAENDAEITNGVVVRGTSGGNGASDNGGDASIRTGDAAAAANVVNIANTNIVNSNYMLLAFNNFGDWGGDLIFPNREFFVNRFFARPGATTPTGDGSGGGRTVSVDHENEASVDSDAGTVADSGGNEASSNQDGIIRTGNALSQTTVFNQVNSSFFNQDSFVVLFKVYGNWSGDVFNAPDNIGWTETPDGVSVYGTDGEGEQASTTPSLLSNEASTTPGTSSSFSVNTKNKASIKNFVRVFALTGGNRANRNGGSAAIESGNAYASTNIVNVANTNIVGRNWVLAIVNIFGDWSGNVSFGQPDLWVGASINESGGARPDNHPAYRFTIANRGDADASNVTLRVRSNRPFLTFNGREEAGDDVWDLGTIPAGASIEAVYTGNIGPSGSFPSYGMHEAVTTVRVASRESESNLQDNSDIISLMVLNPRPDRRRATAAYTSDPVLTVTKSVVGSTSLYQGETGGYKIVLDNRGGPAYHSVLTDTLKNEQGEVISEQQWELGTIEPNEEITVTYQTIFGTSTPPGVYTNYASLHTVGRYESLDPFWGHYVDSNSASTSVTILFRPPEEAGFLGGDGDGGADAEPAIEAEAETAASGGSGGAPFATVATSTVTTAAVAAAPEPEVPEVPAVAWTVQFPPLRKAAFATSSPEPSPEQVLLAAAVNARVTAHEVRIYLMLIIAAFLINHYYRRRISSSGGFAEFL